ncbi:MAG: polysaccharide biosynthesis C-terminal domain-containing protein, partial [Clostridia bacterium]|nr:polysaccharide biosynthesis C-terminal domain-containing protein [Clostridia bacterium]
FGILGVANDFIPFFLGQEYLGSIPILKIMSVLLFLSSMNSLLGVQLLIPLGKEKVYTIATTCGASISVIGNLTLIPFLGVYGSCVACIVAECTVFAVSYWHLRDMFDLKRLLKENAGVIAGSLLMYAVVCGVALVNMNTVLKLVLELGGGMIVYAAVVLLTKNRTCFMILEKVSAFLKRKGA